MAIGIKLTKAAKDSDPAVSKFFGDPVVPRSLSKRDWGEFLFFCQIELSKIAPFDVDGRLPRTGRLYIFLDDANSALTPTVFYTQKEPDTVLDGFNEFYGERQALTQAWEIHFSAVADDAEGHKLFGSPASDWYREEKSLFLQFDPLEDPTGFFDAADGFLYLFFKNGPHDFRHLVFRADYS